jgi:hypothetical protein
MHPIHSPLDTLSLPTAGRSRRVSSNEQPNWHDGNFDMTPLAPGQVLELPLLRGPGMITHIWLTSHSGMMNELNAISMRIYWDDRSTPDVEVPLGDFFAAGPTPAVVDSYPVQVSPSGSLTCFWRMPFRRSARIVFTNDNHDRSTGLYWQVDWVELDELPPESMYFCAAYRNEFPASMGSDYLIADIEGAGNYVGTVLSVTMAQDGWFGEGDDFFYIDGEQVPSLQGTGSEDYFNDAWGFRPRTGPWFGQPRWQGYRAGDSGICYRWHILDPVVFSRSLRVAIEHKGNRPDSADAWYIERPDFLSSVAIWYQATPRKPTVPLPIFSDRCVPWTHHHFVRGFRRASAVHGDLTVHATGLFGGRPTIRFHATGAEPRLTMPFSTRVAGRHALRLVAFAGAGSGSWRVGIDEYEESVTVDLESRSNDGADERDILLGTFDLAKGDHRCIIRPVKGTGSAPDSRHFEGELLKALALPPEATRVPKTHNEAHFVRLAIGRALYAYRMVHDRLPRTLSDLVDAKLMDPRYLNDENGGAFSDSCDGERFVVESPSGWTHSWRGLDARR